MFDQVLLKYFSVEVKSDDNIKLFILVLLITRQSVNQYSCKVKVVKFWSLLLEKTPADDADDYNLTIKQIISAPNLYEKLDI